MKHKALTLTLLTWTALLLITASAPAATQTDMTGPAGSERFGHSVTVLPNGNIVVTDPYYDAPGPVVNVGAVYLYSPNGELISMLTGSTAGDLVGSRAVVVLANGNFVVRTTDWRNGGALNVGAVTWCSGTSGCSGTVSPANSLVGSSEDDGVGRKVVALPNGNYVTSTDAWDDGAVENVGAVTWCSGTSGCTGFVSSGNSLVGTTAGDQIGTNDAAVLANGNYVVSSGQWDNGPLANVGAATWCDGTKGCTGAVSTANSLYGSSAADRVSSRTPIALANGNYVVSSEGWNNGAATQAGAATWCNGATGCVGAVSPANSLVGTTKNDIIGAHITALANGNYVVASDNWDNGAIKDVGSVTWCDGATGRSGEVSPSNSLVGKTTGDFISSRGVTPLANGNYVVASPSWANGPVARAGASTWCSGTAGCTGEISASNSLVGTVANDAVAEAGVTALTSGNYVVRSLEWSNGGMAKAGAATWCNGATGCTGAVSSSNSLVGTTAGDRVASDVTPLTNGNYVVSSPNWNNGGKPRAGAATWCNGAHGCTGAVSTANSLVGSTTDDYVSLDGVVPLVNGNYVVASRSWTASDVGAVTWGSGTVGITGPVSSANSLVGSSAEDEVGVVEALADGNYVVETPGWNSGSAVDVGAVTLARGTAATDGAISPGNSVFGASVGNGDFLKTAYNAATGQLVVGRQHDNIVSLFTLRGANLTVTTVDDHDDGACTPEDCTLREAIVAANAAPDDSIIRFATGLSGTIGLGGALPSLTTNVTLKGPGADVLTVRRNTVGAYRIFTVSNGTASGPDVTIEGLTISDGQATSLMFPMNSGGGILNDRGTVTVRGCRLTGNRPDFSDFNAGGGILNFEGSLTVDECTFEGNTATHGGGVASVRKTAGTASLVLRNSTIRGNTAEGGNGGGFYSEAKENGSSSKATVVNCTFTGNNATAVGISGGSGGAIFNGAYTAGLAELFVQDCTLTGNSASGAGGVYNNNFAAEAFVRLQNTILRNGATGGNFVNSNGSIISLGHNLCDDHAGANSTGTGPGGFLNATSDIRNTDPLLGPLQDNGGPTLTHALLNGSAAINAGESTGESYYDQRGYQRVGANDIGAFEFGGTIPPPPSPTPNPNPTPQPTATPNPTPSVNRLANISTRLRVETGDNVLIGGFIVTGSSQKRIIIRAVGPSLPVEGALPNPVLELYDGNGQFVASNDNWQEASNAREIIESTIAPSNTFESAILREVDPGACTAVVRDAADATGVGLVEVYDLGSEQASQLANISTRGRVLTGDDVMIGGLIVTGVSEQKVILRAIGPSLPVDGRLEDPALELFDGNGNLMAANNNWRDAQQAEIEATSIPPANDLEAAIVTSLPPAAYTAVVRGANDTTGVALIEAYALP